MAWLKSAEKRNRKSIKRRQRNRAVKADLKSAIKAYLGFVKAGKATEAAEQLKVCFGKLDKAGNRRYIHPNAANRSKARLSRRLKLATAAASSGS